MGKYKCTFCNFTCNKLINFKQHNHDEYVFTNNDNIDKKNKCKKIVFVAHPDDESIWGSDILDIDTHVVVIFGQSSINNNVTLCRFTEFKTVMELTKSTWNFFMFSEKNKEQYRINKTSIVKKISEILQSAPNVEKIYTHNSYGEYGHYDHISCHNLVKECYISYYINNESKPTLYEFYPHLNYENVNRLENIEYIIENEKHKLLLDQYKSQTVDIYRNIVLEFKEIQL